MLTLTLITYTLHTHLLLKHGIHAGGEREVEDLDAMMHELYYEGATHAARKRVNQHD